MGDFCSREIVRRVRRGQTTRHSARRHLRVRRCCHAGAEPVYLFSRGNFFLSQPCDTTSAKGRKDRAACQLDPSTRSLSSQWTTRFPQAPDCAWSVRKKKPQDPNPVVRQLMFHQYGNYVLQQALAVAKEPQLSTVVAAVKPIVHQSEH